MGMCVLISYLVDTQNFKIRLRSMRWTKKELAPEEKTFGTNFA